MKILLALLALACCTAFAAPSEITAQYQLTTKGLTIGHVSESYVRTGDNYTISSVSRSEGILKVLYDEQITLQSAGKVGAQGLQPLQFEEHRAREPSHDVNATFDWERGVMQSRFKGETSQVPLPRETQDRISMMYQFMHLKPQSGNFVIAMSNGRKVEHYTYRFVDEVRIGTPMGEFATLHFERVTYGPKDNRAEVWLARDHFNFPVRVVFDDPKGLRFEQTIVTLQSR